MSSKKQKKQSDNSSKSTNKYVQQVIDALVLAAKETGKPEQEVTKGEVLTFVSNYALERAGNLGAVKQAYFPITGKDLAGIKTARNQVSYIKKLEEQLASKEIGEDRILEMLKAIPKVEVKSYANVSGGKSQISSSKRELNLVLSDLHIGSDIKKNETGNLDFGLTEESRRLARLVKDTCDYKRQYRKETKLNVLLLGDIIQNQLHDARDGAPAAEQCGRAIYLLTQAIAQFSANFPKVEVYCNTGNHGRNTGRHHGRAVNQKWDSLEQIVYFAIREACKGMKNVNFTIPKTPYVVYEVFGKKVFATHGDSVLNVGYPGKAINTGRLETQVNRFNASLSDREEYSVLVVGHVHTASITHLSNGAVTITNGAMVPVDEYAVSIGLMETTSGQYMFESTEGFPVGDCRYIKVSIKDDKDSSLDKIIKSWID